MAATHLCVWTGFEINSVMRQIRIPAEYMAGLHGHVRGRGVVHVFGEGVRGPTVVLDTGLAVDAAAWAAGR